MPAVKQIANVAALPGIVGASIALPDVHSGYGFAIGNVAAFDMDDPEAIVSPGGERKDANLLLISLNRPSQHLMLSLHSIRTQVLDLTSIAV